jgi:hypothetical protein
VGSLQTWGGQAREAWRLAGPTRNGSYGTTESTPYPPHEQHFALTASLGVTNVIGCKLHFLDTAEIQEPGSTGGAA